MEKRLAQREANKQKRRIIEKVLSNNVPFNLNYLVDGWLELESDPGTFTLLIEDFGCFGAQVDEIYDLEQKFEGPVFGFIFLFKWLNNSNSNINSNNDKEQPIEDENIISEMFFAKQMISNSCATHALISILLNCDYEQLNLGPTLTRLKEHTRVMNPENKGYAIGNLPELAKAHNSHASYSSLYNRNKSSSHSSTGMSYVISGNQRTNLQQQKKHEAYHFVSYVPINNRLYELDGLKNYPIDHGSFSPTEDWTEKFRSVIKRRLLANKTGDDTTISNDIRYNLMAVVPDKRVSLRAKLKKLNYQQKVVRESIQKLTERVSGPLSLDTDIPNPPYSPLSNATLSADEGHSSTSNSPNDQDESCYDDKKVEKYFFIKFNQQADASSYDEDNLQPAHKNCIIEVESTNIDPLNLKVDTNASKEKTDDKKSSIVINNNNNDEDEDETMNTGDTLDCNTPIIRTKRGRCENLTENRQVETIGSEKVSSVARPKTCSNNETTVNGLRTGSRIEESCPTQAHNNEKYNLSRKPPFDFNILDDMQHVHYGKTALRDLQDLSRKLSTEIDKITSTLKEEVDKRRKYKIDNSRRTHNYEPFIMTFLSMLATKSNLADLIEKDLGLVSVSEETTTPHIADSSTPCTTHKPRANSANTKVSNGGLASKVIPTVTKPAIVKPKYKYVSTGRPVGRPRKNPIVPTPVKTNTNTK